MNVGNYFDLRYKERHQSVAEGKPRTIEKNVGDLCLET